MVALLEARTERPARCTALGVCQLATLIAGRPCVEIDYALGVYGCTV